MQDNLIRDALYNIAPDAGGDVEYAKGILIGVVAVLCATGLEFDQALDKALGLSPDFGNFRFACIPRPWRINANIYACKVDRKYHVRGVDARRDYEHDHWLE